MAKFGPGNPTNSLSRRDVLRAGGLTLGLLAMPPQLLRAETSYSITRVLLRYRTDRKRIARVLPPHLDQTHEPEVWVEYALAKLPDGTQPTLITPASYGLCGIFVRARHGSDQGLYPVGLWTSDEWGRINGREFLGLNVKHGEVTLDVDGDTVRAGVRRFEQTLHQLETVVGGEADETEDGTSDDRAIFTYLYRPNPAWMQEELTGPVDLARIDPSGSGTDSPQAIATTACDVDQTVFQWQHASPADPAIEFPVEEILSVDFAKDTAAHSLLVNPRSRAAPQTLAQVEVADFAPWAMTNYDRPMTTGDAWRPEGWRDSATAYRLSESETASYRERPELRLESVNLVDIQLVTEREAFLEAMPPQFQPGLRLRLMALRVDQSDFSVAPFNEVWLFAYGLLENRPVWFALSHIVSAGGDLTFGRETFGYPTKRGDIDVITTPIDFSVLGRRKGRDFVYTEGGFQGFSTGTSLAQMEIACLHAGSFGKGEPRGELIVQPWYFQGKRSFVNRETLITEFPNEEAARGIGLSDPWSEFNPFRVVSVTVMQNGGMQRMPGEVVAGMEGVAPYYLERCDGVLPGSDPASDATAPSFRVKPGVTTRSALPSHHG